MRFATLPVWRSLSAGPAQKLSVVARFHRRDPIQWRTICYKFTFMKLKEGSPHPRGATWNGEGTNFTLFSANATKVEISIFDPKGEREIERIALPEYTDQVWHGYLSDIGPGT